MLSSILLHITTFLSLFTIFTLAQTPQPSSTDCLTYSRIANLSTIGKNSTYRSAFLQASPFGTFKSAAILNRAIVQLPPLTINAALNQQCGNLTTLARTEAERNFTQHVVLEFAGVSADPQHIFAGILLLPMVGLIGLVFYGVWANA